jgi:hypothetical protein
MAERPLELAVVGHTNAGKTSLLRTLTRRRDFGEVSPLPGTTRHVQTIDLRIDGVPAVRFADTPGLEDPVALLELVKAIPEGMTPADRIRAFLRRPEAQGAFEQEAKVLRAMLAADAAFYVIDCREAVLPKYHSEIELLHACGTPVMPVLNHLRHPAAREAQWRRALAEHGLHAQAGFDAVAPFTGAEMRLYQDLATLLGARRPLLERVARHLEQERRQRQLAGLRTIASHLVGQAARRVTLEREVVENPARREAALAAFRQAVAAQARRAADDLLLIHAFRPEDADLATLPGLAGRWEDDLFNPQVLQAAARRFGAGAAVGAAVGLGLDVALAGLSLGTAAALGATVGGLASQGFGPLGRALRNKLSGQQDLTLEDQVLLVLASRLLALLNALEQRGHAATSRLAGAEGDGGVVDDERSPLLDMLRALQPARAHPDWADGERPAPGSASRREQLVDKLVPPLESALQSLADANRSP